MPRIKLTPIAEAQYASEMQDDYTSAGHNAEGQLVISIGTDADIVGTYTSDILDRIEVDIKATASSRTVSRLNRLLDGLNAPKVETYHRTGRIMVRLPGAPADLPCTIVGTLGSPRWSWLQSSAPVAPEATPTPPPSAPDTRPQSFAEAQGQAQDRLDEASATITVAKPQTGSKRDLFAVPPRSTTHRIVTGSDDRDVLNAAWQLHRTGQPATVMLEGPAGTGKTSLVEDFAADEQVPMFVYDGAAASSWADWTGTTVLRNGNGSTITEFAWSSFIEAIREDGPYGDQPRIVLVDEVNRAESAAALNALMPILSAARIFVAEADVTIKVSKAVFFVFTMNRGYAGTQTLDAALADRMWTTIRLDYLNEQDETALVSDRTGISAEDAGQLVKVARQVREIAERGSLDEAISTRSVLQAAFLVRQGLKLKVAATACWANAYDAKGGAESDRGMVLQTINSLLP